MSCQGNQPQESKIEAIQQISEPQTVQDVRSFLGMTGYYRQCIPDYAEIVEPLVRLTKKNELFIFGEEQKEAFVKLKHVLCSHNVMAYPDPRKPYKLYTDVSEYAVGGIFIQQDENGVERVIQYISKQLSTGQQKWSATEHEAFAVIYAHRKLRPYLDGAEFTVYTDHKPLKSLFQCEIKNTRVQRWAMQISEFSCQIEYRKGKNNVRADMLSRIKIAAVQEVIEQSRFGDEQKKNFLMNG